MELKYFTARGEVFTLSANPYCQLINIDGHTNVQTSLSSSVVGGIDGDTVNNVQAIPRTIILDLLIKDGVSVETAKRNILRFIKPKQRGTLEWSQENRTVIISGIIESIDMPRWNNSVIMQVTMHCEKPYWQDIDYVIKHIRSAIELHYFTTSPYDMLYFPESGIPFGEIDSRRVKTFTNNGDVSVGVEISINALDTVTNPIIYDSDGNFLGIGYGTDTKKLVMESGDNLVVTTHKGNKTVTLNGVSVFSKIKPNSTWLQMPTGDNEFAINSNDENIGNMNFTIVYKQEYI